ncbi:MAG TPA: hypothetical protein VF981_08655 [Gemmatimonadaceae bacterium]
MRHTKWLAGMLTLVVAGCVSTADFNAYKAEVDTYKAAVRADGDALEVWIAQAHLVVKWVAANGGTFCPGCTPPNAPPDPPPDGNWGT